MSSVLATAGQRARDTSTKVRDYNLVDVLRTGKSGAPLLAPGDIVVVDEVISVFMTGYVREPKEVKLLEGMTLTRAIASAGGVLMLSDAVRVRIIRRRDIGQYLNPILVDLKAVREGRATDVLLKPWDIVEVSDRQGNFLSPRIPGFPVWDTPIKPHLFRDPPVQPRKDNSIA